MKARRANILVLTGDWGDGHTQAAQALQQTATASFSHHAQVQIVDILQLFSPRLHALCKTLFLRLIRTCPRLYTFLYERTRNESRWSRIFEPFSLMSSHKIKDLIDALEPDLIVCTFPLAAATVSRLKQNQLIDQPVFTIITDHTCHTYWLHACTDHYIVASTDIRSDMIRSGLEPRQITAAGIPVKPSFLQQYDRMELARKHACQPERTTLLWMGGGYGMMGDDMLALIGQIIREYDVQIIIVCGRNQKLWKQCRKRFHHQPAITCTGYVEHIHELMAISDFIITKAGGLTTAEAMSQTLPMVLYRPLPGQEEENAHYFVERGCAWLSRHPEQLLRQIEILIQSPSARAAIRANIRLLHNQKAAFTALQTMLNVHVQARQTDETAHPTSLLLTP
ncbi:MGDG synthase family glycosyltransferase [Marinicrinis sediminis]|uniref:Glycosyltransferase n=1 Tax=Marinicrinis sediminis TaxID=1652465 RepID=A0ABW5R6K2_9BACL